MQDRPVSASVWGTVRLSIATLCVSAAIFGQSDRQEVEREPRLPFPDSRVLAGTWRYQFTSEQPPLSAAVCGELADGISRVRTWAPSHAIESLVRDERYLRELSRQADGRPGNVSVEQFTMVTAAADAFYQRVEWNGGWQADSSVGSTDQVLRSGDELWHRNDPSPRSGVSSVFNLDRVVDGQTADRCVLASEWRQHAIAVNYCLDHGSAVGERRWTVDREAYSASPPTGLAILYIGDSMSLIWRAEGAKDVYSVALFDASGRTCKEWESEWVDGRPLRLEEVLHFSAGAFVNMRRQTVVSGHEVAAKLPDIQEFAVTPVEVRVADDLRVEGARTFDPLGEIPVVPAEPGSGQAPGPAADPADERPRKEVVDAEPVTLTGIPKSDRDGRGRTWPWIVGALALVALLVLTIARRSRSSAAVLLLLPLLTGCEPRDRERRPQMPARPTTALVEVAPATVHVVPSKGSGEIRRYRFTCMNSHDQTVKILFGVPSCGCLIADLESRVIEPYCGSEFDVYVDMAHFVDADLVLSWAVDDGSHAGSSKVRFRRSDA